MQSVGEKLRQARIEQNLSLEEVYRQTKVYVHVLEALEQDRAHNFLSFVYIKSFLKTYARFLGLDGEALLKEYVESQHKERVVPAEEPVENQKKFALKLKLNPFLAFRLALIVAFSLGLFFFFRYAARSIVRQSRRSEAPKINVRLTPGAQTVSKNLNLQIKAKQDCWVKVTADGKVVFEKTLTRGKLENWQAVDGFQVRLGKPEAVDVLLDGGLIDLEQAKVKKGLVITREGVVGQ